MKKFYITGISGSGKSSVAEKLKEKGVYTIDIDSIDGLCRWINNDTQEVEEWHHGMEGEWYRKHRYICNKEKLIDLINNSDKNIIVVAGLPNNRSELLDLFDKVFLLQCREETFIKRIEERTNNDFGKHALEKENILSWYKNFEKKTLEEGAIPIDTDRSLADVTEEIFSKF